MRVTILGAGSATGTPAVGLGWGRCDPNQPRNRRLRPSILVEEPESGTAILVDTSPDLRQQLLNAGISRLDGVLYTHFHADHLHGIDDLRPINRAMRAPLDIYADDATLKVIERRFGYVFEPLAEDATEFYKPTLIAHEIGPGRPQRVGAVEVMPFAQNHGYGTTLGFRFGSVAYSTDLVELGEEAFALLAGVETWIVGTLGDRPHPTHAHVDKALAWIERVRPARGVLSHLGIGLDYDGLRKRLPAHVEPAYDGMIIDM